MGSNIRWNRLLMMMKVPVEINAQLKGDLTMKNTLYKTWILLAGILCVSALNIYAADVTTEIYGYDQYGYQFEFDNAPTIITDTVTLNQIIEDENLEVPEGYELTEVEVLKYSSTDDLNLVTESEDLISTFGWLHSYYIGYVSSYGDGYYDSYDYDADWFDGPCSVNETYSRSDKAEITSSVSLSSSALSAGLGYNKSTTFTKSKSFSTTVSEGKKLQVKIWTNLGKYYFKIYDALDDDSYAGYGYSYKPVGLLFKQYTYTCSSCYN